MWTKYDFDFNGTETNNMRLKWLSICFNIDYDNGSMELYLNGESLPGKKKKDMTLPANSSSSPLIVRLGRYFFDDTTMIGKMIDFNMWDR